MSIFVIAEIGINHNGDLNLCKKLIDTAVNAGCNAVKFQKRTINKVYSKDQLNSLRESPWGTTTYQQKMGLEFGKKEYKIIDNYCKKKNILWFASAWDVDSQKFLKQFKLKYNKIASAMITDHKFLKFVANEKKHTFISTGMSTVKMIDNAVKIFKKNNALLKLCTVYPPIP